jgi:hypothetical protein
MMIVLVLLPYYLDDDDQIYITSMQLRVIYMVCIAENIYRQQLIERVNTPT